MRIAFPLLLALASVQPALAQSEPKLPLPLLSTTFYQDPKAVMLACVEASRSLGGMDGDTDHQAERGWAYLAAGQSDKAEAIFQTAIKDKKAGAETYRLIGLAYLHLGDTEKALKAYELVVDANKGTLTGIGGSTPTGMAGTSVGVTVWSNFSFDKSALARAAGDLVKTGHVREATKYMDQYYFSDSGDSAEFVKFGRAALLVGEQNLAARYFAYAVKADPKDKDVWSTITDAYAEYLTKHSAPTEPVAH